MQWPGWSVVLLFVVDAAIRVGLSIRVIMRRQNTGVSISWLIVILTFPFLGAAAYWLVGENHVGMERARREAALRGPYDAWRANVRQRIKGSCADIHPESRRLAREVEATCGSPLMPGNQIELVEDSIEALDRIIADIDAAESSVHMQFYIWETGGKADEAVAALLRARKRGVRVRVLVDEIGGSPFLQSGQPALLREHGAEVVAALPVGLVRALFTRMDLRNHRKLVVIDGEIAYIGSQNLADPHLFRHSEGIGEWIDAMARVRGPLVEAFGVSFAADWELETGEGVEKIAEEGNVHTCAVRGGACAQLVVSGPGLFAGVYHSMLLSAIYQAREELILTTPYFVPDESVRAAIISAARRGVRVLVIVPHRVDSRLVAAASRAHFIDLLDVGVEIAQYRVGMMNTKAVVVDGRIGMFGTVNLDQRSFFLNFEATLVGYDAEFAGRLREQQLRYASRAERLSAKEWKRRPFLVRLAENSTGLLAPLL